MKNHLGLAAAAAFACLGSGATPDNDRLFATGVAATIEATWGAGPHEATLPLDGEVVDFSET